MKNSSSSSMGGGVKKKSKNIEPKRVHILNRQLMSQMTLPSMAGSN
jgi:hypothetical protein